MKKNEKSWLAVRVTTNPAIEDAIVNFLFEIGSCGCQQTATEVTAYFGADRSAEKLQGQISAYLKELANLGLPVTADTPIIETIANRDWNAQWKANFKAVAISERLIVKPTWEPIEAPKGAVVIDIDPKQAFGTGHHASTRLALKFLETQVQPRQTVLDVGTGSGILAIAAVKLGAARVVALDNDFIATQTAQQNFRLNSVQKQILLLNGEVAAIKPGRILFDIVVANLQKHTILILLPQLKPLLREGGLLFISGILLAEKQEMIEALCRHSYLAIREMPVCEEWLGLLVSKEPLE